jgi:lipid-A-disaccharide synthase-like uncharacterized protein
VQGHRGLNAVMNLHLDIIFFNNRFFGIEWHAWKIVGWAGNVLFFSRFFVQWWATEKNKQVVVPNSFWWLSLFGSLMLLAYGLYRRDSVFIFAYAFTWIPYIRNLVISHRSTRDTFRCAKCETLCAPTAVYCSQCGHKVGDAPEPVNA